MKKIITLIFMTLIVGLIGCGDRYKTKTYIKKAVSFAQKGDYQKSKEYLDEITKLKNIDVDELIRNLNNNDEQFKCFLIETLGRIGDKKSVEPLISILEKENNQNIQIYVIDALGMLRDKRALPVLEKFAKSNVWGIKLLADNAIENISGKKIEIKTVPKK